MLLVTRQNRHSENIPEHGIYDVYRRNPEAFRVSIGTNRLLGSEGFALRLLSLDGTLVDMAGNLSSSFVRVVETGLLGAYTYWGLPSDHGTPFSGKQDAMEVGGCQSRELIRGKKFAFSRQLWYH